MPIQIGAKSHNFSDPTGLLYDCHRRVEMFLGILEAVGKIIDQPPSEETTRALQSALRYFAEAAPKHTADEEESLFPRLRQLSDLEVGSAFLRLDRLEADHRWAAPLHSEVEQLGAKYLFRGPLSAPEVDRFRASVADLIAMYQQHINAEDELIFPLAARLLSEHEKKAIANEMAKRRKLRSIDSHLL
ncbi:MAG TPA: hemerythrin domain-containing protein [Terriglobales bacterium]|nr:hemerythrin domain-containing protein [Terriglobales bacterium]